jgi:hypothetical protein
MSGFIAWHHETWVEQDADNNESWMQGHGLPGFATRNPHLVKCIQESFVFLPLFRGGSVTVGGLKHREPRTQRAQQG